MTRLLLLAALIASPAAAQVVVTDATATATGKDRARVVATITSPVADELVSCSTPIARMCEPHQVVRLMVKHPIALKAGVPRRLSVKGAHLMPMGIATPIPAAFPLTLTFAHAQAVTVQVNVR